MAVYRLTDEEEEIAKEDKWRRQHTNRYGNVLCEGRLRKPWKVPLKQKMMMIVMQDIARTWRNELTAAQRLQWGVEKRNLKIRDDTVQSKNPWTRFVQVQTPLHYTGKPLATTSDTVKHYLVSDIEVQASAWLQEIGVTYQLSKKDATASRSVMFVSQVPPDYIETDHLWQYAVLLGATELSTSQITPAFSHPENPYAAKFPFKEGDKLQVYIRIVHVENTNPPIDLITSHETTEDWTGFTFTAGI